MVTSSDVSFHLMQNSKRWNEFDNEKKQAGPSSKKSPLETIIESYENLNNKSVALYSDEDGHVNMNNTVKHGREKNNMDDLYDIVVEEGAELNKYQHKNKIKEYTAYLKAYSEYDVFEPILEKGDSKEVKEQNCFRRKNLTHCILKSIMGAIYRKNH